VNGPDTSQGQKLEVGAVRDVAPRLSLVICTRNRSAQLARCLKVVSKLRSQSAWEIVLVDNGSTDDTAQVIESQKALMPAPVKSIQEMVPGLGRARNAGIKAASGDIIVFTDDDCYPNEDWLVEIDKAFMDRGLGFLTGKVVLHDPDDYPISVNLLEDARDVPAGTYVSPYILMGANLAFRREALEKIGGFDSNLGAGTRYPVEDVDAAARVVMAGWSGAYRPNIVVRHHHGRKEVDVAALCRGYDYARGAYHMKLLLRGRPWFFARGIISLRWRFSMSSLIWETRGGTAYLWDRLSGRLSASS
jgi:glycosyltransferase involved in cell wall biosynthesis